jgi:hypothetical protein
MEGAASSWRLAANILNNQPRTTTRGGPPTWGLGVGLTTPHRIKQACYERINEPRTWTDFLDKGPKQRNMDMRFGTAQDRYRWEALVNSVMNLRVHKILGTTEWLHNLWPLERYSAPHN